MDRLTAFVALSHARLRVEIEEYSKKKSRYRPGATDMATPFLQGLTKAMDMLEHDLETGAKGLHNKIVSVGDRGKAALDKGHQKMDAVASRIGEVEKFVTDLEGSNGGGPLDDSSNSSEELAPKQSEISAEPAASWGGSK